MEDKQKYPRLNWSVNVHWQKVFETFAPRNASSSKNISQGGIRLILRDGIIIGDILDFEIELGGGKNIRTRGRVVWVDKFEITGGKHETGYEGGIEFLDLSEDTRREIASFMMKSREGEA